MKRKDARKKRIDDKVESVINAYRSTGTDTDPNGMYTGVTQEVELACAEGKVYMNPSNSVPTQDADDL